MKHTLTAEEKAAHRRLYPHMQGIKRRKVGDRSYEVLRDGQRVGHVVMTGEHGRDDYPWNFDADATAVVPGYAGRVMGACDTLTTGIEYVAMATHRKEQP